MNENNPFNENMPVRQQYKENAMVDIEQQRAISEVQSSLTIAKRFPRNQIEAMDRILQACARPSLADSAIYTYARGGTDISGPSIRLAECLVQAWGNIEYGIRVLSQTNDTSTVESYAWDLESNTRQVRVFQVQHTRYSKSKGHVKLTDPRDIYELTANQGARRLRACMLGVLPGDIVDAAVKQCEETLKIKADVTPERIQSIIDKFAQFGVTKGMIELKIQRRIDAMTPALVVYLGKIFNSLKDGMSAPSDWFQQDPATVPATLADELKAKLPKTIIEQQPDHIRDTTEMVDEPVKTFRDEYINLKHAGFATFVFQNLDRLKNCSETLHAEAVAKWNKLYPDQLCPFLQNKDNQTHTSTDSTHTDQTKQKAPIVCKKDEQHRGVFPDDCTACGKLDGCDQYSEYIFDLEHQNQPESSDSSGF
jgi:hypothetical protein